MGMQYNVTYHNATIKPERYSELIGWDAEDVTAEPEKAAELALEGVREMLCDSGGDPEQDESGIHLDGCGYYDSASYSYGNDLEELLRHCEPGAYIHEIDAEEGSGGQWRRYLMPDGSIKTVEPELVWPEVGQ